MTNPSDFINVRTFDAPAAKLWKAWTDPELFAQWYGPGVETKIHEWTLEEGSPWRGEMVMQPPMRFGGHMMTVTPQSIFAFTQASADDNWQAIDNPMMPGWPKFMLAHVAFKDLENGKTEQTLTWSPHEASEAEHNLFASMKDKMGGGWGKGFDMLASIVEG